MYNIPKIVDAKLDKNRTLIITFDNGVIKLYSNEKLFSRPEFRMLEEFGMLKSFSIEPGGYAISWNDEVDISENELWLEGVEV